MVGECSSSVTDSRQTPIKQQKRTPANKQGGVGRQQQHLNATTNDLCELFQRKGLHFIRVNARNLLPKVSEIRVLANRTNAAVICETETWFDSSVTDAEVEIPGYLIQRRDRSGEEVVDVCACTSEVT